MTWHELLTMVERQRGQGLGSVRLVLTAPRPKRGLRGHRLRTPFGLCEVASISQDRVVFFVEMAKVERWLHRNNPSLWRPE